eukprot:g1930.t1
MNGEGGSFHVVYDKVAQDRLKASKKKRKKVELTRLVGARPVSDSGTDSDDEHDGYRSSSSSDSSDSDLSATDSEGSGRKRKKKRSKREKKKKKKKKKSKKKKRKKKRRRKESKKTKKKKRLRDEEMPDASGGGDTRTNVTKAPEDALAVVDMMLRLLKKCTRPVVFQGQSWRKQGSRAMSSSCHRRTYGEGIVSNSNSHFSTTAANNNMAPKTSNVALLLDIDNLLITQEHSAKIEDHEIISAVMEEAERRGRVVVKKAYMDSVRYQSLRAQFAKCGIEIVDLPVYRKDHREKNGADIKMTVDAMCLALADNRSVDTFVIASGDSDFTPLLQKLRESDRRTVVLSRPKNLSSHLRHFADEVADIDSTIHAKPLEPEEYEQVLKSAVVCCHSTASEESRFVDLRTVYKFLRQWTSAVKDTSLAVKNRNALELLLKRSDASKYFEIVTDARATLIRPKAGLDLDLVTCYEDFQLVLEHLLRVQSLHVEEPIRMSYMLKAFQQTASALDSTSNVNYGQFVRALRNTLRDDGVHVSSQKVTRIMRLLVAFDFLQDERDAKGGDGEMKTDEREVTEGDDNDVAEDDRDEPVEKDSGEEGGEVGEEPSPLIRDFNLTKDGTILLPNSFHVAESVTSGDYSSFRAAFDMEMVRFIQEVCGHAKDSSASFEIPLTAEFVHRFLHGPHTKNGSDAFPKSSDGNDLKPPEASDVTRFRVESLLNGDEPTMLPVPSTETVDEDIEEEVKRGFLKNAVARFRSRFSTTQK